MSWLHSGRVIANRSGKPQPRGRPIPNRYNSEAFRYLSTFHRSIHKGENEKDLDEDSHFSMHRARYEHTTPSLGTTPTTAASSPGWAISASVGFDNDHGRPLLPRHNRWYSTSCVNFGGTDLVTPHIVPATSDIYAKKDINVQTPTKGGIGAFFGYGDI